MTMDAFSVTLRAYLDSVSISVSREQLEKLKAFQAILAEANKSFNLTSIDDPADMAIHHFADSLSLPALNLIYSGDRVIDVGTGAGFPGVPIAILRESIHMTLLDSMRKRTAFLESAVARLSLGNVTVVTARAEEYARSAFREQFDAALSRAVAPLNVLFEYMLPFLKPGGRALAWKGPAAAAEAETAGRACRVLGGGEIRLHRYSLPDRKDFYIAEAEKIRHTPANYPRKAGKPATAPLI